MDKIKDIKEYVVIEISDEQLVMMSSNEFELMVESNAQEGLEGCILRFTGNSNECTDYVVKTTIERNSCPHKQVDCALIYAATKENELQVHHPTQGMHPDTHRITTRHFEWKDKDNHYKGVKFVPDIENEVINEYIKTCNLLSYKGKTYESDYPQQPGLYFSSITIYLNKKLEKGDRILDIRSKWDDLLVREGSIEIEPNIYMTKVKLMNVNGDDYLESKEFFENRELKYYRLDKPTD